MCKTHNTLLKIIYLLSMTMYISYLSASAYGPGLIFHKPYSTSPYLGHFKLHFSGGKTNHGYNKHGQVVSFLQEYGSEDLLRKFLDPTIPKTDTQSVGTIAFAGNLDIQRMNLSYYKNIHHNLFIGIGTAAQNLTVSSITMNINLTTTLNPLEQQELKIFESKIPKTLNSAGILTTYIECGFNKKFTGFEGINFLQLFLKGSISTPQWVTGNRLSLLQYPLAGNLSFAYPITAIVTLGITEHINFGALGTIIPFQPTEIIAPINSTHSNNKILLSEYVRGIYTPGTVYGTTLYIEIYNFIPHLISTTGFGAVLGGARSLSPLNKSDFAPATINANPVFESWNISSAFFQLDYSILSKEHPQAPQLSVYYVIPLTGKYYPKINIWGGSFGLMFNYHF